MRPRETRRRDAAETAGETPAVRNASLLRGVHPALLISVQIILIAILMAAMANSAPPPLTLGASGSELTYVVLGDSTAAGVGGTYDAGIAVSTAKGLARDRRVTMTNLAVSGARIRDVRERQLADAEALRPDVVLLAVGANDVTHLTRVGAMRDDLREIIRRLTAANRDVKIVLTGSPDMGSPPRIPRVLRGLSSHRTRVVNHMFREEAARLQFIVAPIAEKTGPLFRRDRSLFAADRFHPNARGYATWIPILDEALSAAIH